MHPVTRSSLVMFVALCLLACAGSASAQSVGYVAGSAFADIRQFGSTSTRTELPVEDVSRNATGVGGSIRAGTWLHPRWTIEVGADLSSKTSTTVRGPVIAIFPPVPPLEFTSSTSFASVTTMVGFHSPEGRRVRLGYLAGFSFVRVTYTTEFPSLPLGTIFDDDDFSLSFFEFRPASIPRASLLLPPTTVVTTRNSGALALGIEAA